MTLRTDGQAQGLGLAQHLPTLLAKLLPARLPTTIRPWRASVGRYLALAVLCDFTIAAIVVAVLTTGGRGITEAAALALAAGLGFIITIAGCRGYRGIRVASGAGEFHSLFRVAGVLAVASLAVHYVGVTELPGATFIEALGVTIALALVARALTRLVVRHLRARGMFVRRTLLVGSMESLNHIFEVLDEARSHGLVIVGVCTPTPPDSTSTRSPVLGRYESIPQLVDEFNVDEVLIAADAMEATDLRRLGWRLADRPTGLLVLPSITEVVPRRVHMESLGGTPLLGVALTTPRPSRWTKAVFDRAVGATMLIVALPIITIAAILVRSTSRGPALFKQTRVGIDGRPFTMHKLRSMTTDAEKRLPALREHNDGNGVLFKLREDPRVTPVGRVLRRLSIDELPQLWNVVTGQMSLVGPRPALPEEVAAFNEDARHRLCVKPGLTGLWQVSGRSNLSAAHSARLDLRYADNWSMAMDLTILWRTARAVLGGKGAY
ncbi:sugar transferase [Georgenia sp. MJ173]|uniref:sugar transferase n=1 Tax=Georgenia sunbinii TaxID=3117728 RepID=UPI002F260768